MKVSRTLVILIFSLILNNAFASENLKILAKHYDAYNKGDIEALAATIHNEIEEITFPNRRKSKNKQEMLENWDKTISTFTPIVTTPYVSEIGDRIVVIEKLQLFDEGQLVEEVEIAGIYEFKDG